MLTAFVSLIEEVNTGCYGSVPSDRIANQIKTFLRSGDMDIGNKLSVQNAEHYKWGQNNDGWHLLKSDELSVIEERMNPGGAEQLHYHHKAQQFFYILSGKAVFEIAEQLIELNEGEAVRVPPGIPHRIFNKSSTDLRFILVSSPRSHGDRTDPDIL